MSDSDKKELQLPNQTSGFTLKELEDIENYREAGLPDIIDVTDEKLMSAFNMRLDGRSFREIAKVLGLKKITIMHLAEKYDWHQRRIEFLDGYEMHLKEQVLEEKIHSQYFLMKAMHVFRRRMGKKFDNYLRTGDESIGASIDMEEISLYIKMAQSVANLDAKGIARGNDGQPAVGLNVGEGVIMKKLSDNTVEITPRQKSMAEMLAELAKNKREQKEQDKK